MYFPQKLTSMEPHQYLHQCNILYISIFYMDQGKQGILTQSLWKSQSSLQCVLIAVYQQYPVEISRYHFGLGRHLSVKYVSLFGSYSSVYVNIHTVYIEHPVSRV